MTSDSHPTQPSTIAGSFASRQCPLAGQAKMPRDIFILNFHGIGRSPRPLAPSEERVWLERAHFEAILDLIVTRSDIELTFDDANESDFTVALPSLQARDLKAQFFLVAQRIGQPGYLSSVQANSLSAAGMKIGNHGMRHRPWAGLSKSELRNELVESKDILEQLLGVSIDKASCPFGSYNRRVLAEVARVGYRGVYTSDRGRCRRDAFVLPRNSVYRTCDVSAIKALVSSKPNPAGKMLSRVKLLVKRWR